MRNTSQLSLVFVGCGGTFFMGMPYFRVLARQYEFPGVHFVDPDRVKGKNQNRQWPSLGSRSESKASAARRDFECSGSSCSWEQPFKQFISLARRGSLLVEGNVLLVVNVDNDAARLEVREWAKNREGWTGMVVSGCEADYGQAYWGAWQDGVAIHDWRRLHEDVGQEEGTEHRCAPQTAEANAMTGVLAGLALKDALRVYQEGECPLMVREYYWERTHPPLSLVRSWTLEVKRQAEVILSLSETGKMG